MSFLASTIDWFTGKQSAHMGPDQYVAHSGTHNGSSMSGAFLWEKSEKATVSTNGNMVNAETNLLQSVERDIGNYLPLGIPVIELGPGTAIAFKNKTLRIAKNLNSQKCVLVDESIAFLKQIAESSFGELAPSIEPVVDDFFENETPYCDEEALVCTFGSTISNFVGPISAKPPQEVLTDGLIKMMHAANNGWMLIGFDGDQDGERIKAFYRTQADFQLNIFYRMQAELSIKGDFSPQAFIYEPEWNAESGQLSHIAVVTRDLNFVLNGVEIVLKQGQKLHIKNSYKYSPAFFEKCAERAGLEVVKAWSDNSTAKIYLLKILPREIPLLSSYTPPLAHPKKLNVA